MGYDLTSILELCAIAVLVFSFAGIGMLMAVTRSARREFRVKGFLRPPSGFGWIRFLVWKHYDMFDSPTTRRLFSAIHFCMIGVVIALGGAAALIGSDLLLNGTNSFNINTKGGFPTISISK